jgi:hypothetical protein
LIVNRRELGKCFESHSVDGNHAKRVAEAVAEVKNGLRRPKNGGTSTG